MFFPSNFCKTVHIFINNSIFQFSLEVAQLWTLHLNYMFKIIFRVRYFQSPCAVQYQNLEKLLNFWAKSQPQSQATQLLIGPSVFPSPSNHPKNCYAKLEDNMSLRNQRCTFCYNQPRCLALKSEIGLYEKFTFCCFGRTE